MTLKNSFINDSCGVGSYDYWIGPKWDTTRFRNGTYRLVVTAADIRGNATTKTAGFTVANVSATGTAVSPA